MLKSQVIMILLVAVVAGSLLQCKTPDPLPRGDADNGGLILPGQFDALVVAERTGRARHIAVRDNGDIYVKLTYNDSLQGAGGTVGLRDNNHDGKADTIVYFGDYLDEGGSAVGVTIHNGYLYTSTVRKIYRNKLTPGKLIPESETELVLTDEDEQVVRNWHTTKPVAFDEQGYLYVPFGSPSDACQDLTQYGPAGIPNGKGLDPCPELEKHAGIWRFDASKTNLTQNDGERYATGLRSIVGMQWNPSDQSLYAVVNGIDNFHTLFPDQFTAWQAAVLPAELMTKIEEGADFGWPYAYYDHMLQQNMLQPGYGGDGQTIGRAKEFDKPSIGFPGHWAPMDLLFYQGHQFPARYRNGVFVAFHGSTDRSPYPQAGYVVCFVPFENGAPNGKWEVFADGFTGVDTVINTSDARYRPMGLAEGPDGSLYISESNQGKIWRVMYRGGDDPFGDAQLEPMEKRKLVSYIKTPDEKADNLNRGDELSGRILYRTYCAGCHLRNGKGDSNRYPPLAGSEWVVGDPDQLIGIVLHGRQGKITVSGKTYDGLMPGNAHLDDHALASILTYIRMNFSNSASPVNALQVEAIRKLQSKKK